MSEYLRKGELFPVAGENRSVPSTILPQGHTFPENLHYTQGELRKRDGRSQIGDLSVGAHHIMHLGIFRLQDGTIRLIRHTNLDVERYNTSSKVFDVITGAALTGDTTKFFSHTVVTEDDLYLFTNLKNNIRKYNDSGVTEDLGGAAGLFKAKFVEYMSPYVFAAFTEESGATLSSKGRWSGTGAPEVWNSGNAGSQLFSADSTEIQNVKKLKDLLFVYKSGMSYWGRIVTTSDIFDFDIFQTGRGLYAPRALIEADGRHFYMGQNDFHVNNGARIENIGDKVREFIFNRLNRSLNETCHAIHVEEFKEIWFYITVGSNDWPTEVWKYNYQYGFWYKDTCLNIISSVNYKVIGTRTWDDLVGTWDQQVWSWDDQSGGADAPQQIFGNDVGITTKRDNALRADNGVAYAARQETMDYTGLVPGGASGPGPILGLEHDQEWIQLDIWAKGDSFKVYFSIDYGDTWSFIRTVTLTQAIKKHTIFFHVIAEHIRFKFENETAGEDFTVRHFIPYYVDAGELENP